MRAQDPRLLWGELGSLRGAVRLVHLVFLLRYSTGAQSIGSQEQVQHENAKSTQYRDQQPTSAPNASNNVTNDYSTSVLIGTSAPGDTCVSAAHIVENLRVVNYRIWARRFRTTMISVSLTAA